MEIPGIWVIIGIFVLAGALVGALVLAACTVADKFYGIDFKRMIMCHKCGENEGGVSDVEKGDPPQPCPMKVEAKADSDMVKSTSEEGKTTA